MVKLKADKIKKYVDIFHSTDDFDAIEKMVFILADELGWDPYEVRMRDVVAVLEQVSAGQEYVYFEWRE